MDQVINSHQNLPNEMNARCVCPFETPNKSILCVHVSGHRQRPLLLRAHRSSATCRKRQRVSHDGHTRCARAVGTPPRPRRAFGIVPPQERRPRGTIVDATRCRGPGAHLGPSRLTSARPRQGARDWVDDKKASKTFETLRSRRLPPVEAACAPRQRGGASPCISDAALALVAEPGDRYLLYL